MSFHDLRFAHVSYAEEQTQRLVSLAYEGFLREHKRLRPLLGTREFGENEASHQGLDDEAETALNHDGDNCNRTISCDVSDAVAYGLLGFYGEKESRSEIVYLTQTRLPVWLVFVHKVVVHEANEPPQKGEE